MLLSPAREERALRVDTMGELNLKPESLLGSSAAIRVLIAEDFPAFRQFVCSTVTKRPDLQVIGEVSDGLEAVQKAVELKPDLILLDVGLPTMNGIEAARRIRALVPESKIIFLSQETSGEVMEEALSTGARGYVVKAKAGSQLLAAIGAAMSDAVLQ
jgi:DNA-binding NarL/FixJ family response regulator